MKPYLYEIPNFAKLPIILTLSALIVGIFRVIVFRIENQTLIYVALAGSVD